MFAVVDFVNLFKSASHFSLFCLLFAAIIMVNKDFQNSLIRGARQKLCLHGYHICKPLQLFFANLCIIGFTLTATNVLVSWQERREASATCPQPSTRRTCDKRFTPSRRLACCAMFRLSVSSDSLRYLNE